LVLLPVNTIKAPVYAAGMPALSRLIDRPERYRSMFRQIMQKLALLTMPVFAVAAVLADWLVVILFGPAWAQAIPLVALFSVSVAYLPVLMAASLLYMTQARSGEMLRASLIDAACCVVAILVGLRWGVTGVAASIAVAGGWSVCRSPSGWRRAVVRCRCTTSRQPLPRRSAPRSWPASPCGWCVTPRLLREHRRWAACCWWVSAAWPPSGSPCSLGRRPGARSRGCP
jgi:hypothetical protein